MLPLTAVLMTTIAALGCVDEQVTGIVMPSIDLVAAHFVCDGARTWRDVVRGLDTPSSTRGRLAPLERGFPSFGMLSRRTLSLSASDRKEMGCASAISSDLRLSSSALLRR